MFLGIHGTLQSLLLPSVEDDARAGMIHEVRMMNDMPVSQLDCFDLLENGQVIFDRLYHSTSSPVCFQVGHCQRNQFCRCEKLCVFESKQETLRLCHKATLPQGRMTRVTVA